MRVPDSGPPQCFRPRENASVKKSLTLILKRLPMLLPLLLLCGGCLFEPYRETVRYDLGVSPVPETGKKPSAALSFREFQNCSGSGTRFRYRHTDGRLEDDPYCKWILPPEELLPRALNLMTAVDGAPRPAAAADVLIRVFEADLGRQVFVLAGEWRITPDGRPTVFHIEEPLTGTGPEAVVRAASAATAQLGHRITATVQP